MLGPGDYMTTGSDQTAAAQEEMSSRMVDATWTHSKENARAVPPQPRLPADTRETSMPCSNTFFFVDPPKPKIEEIGSLRWTFGDRLQSIKIRSHQPEKIGTGASASSSSSGCHFLGTSSSVVRRGQSFWPRIRQPWNSSAAPPGKTLTMALSRVGSPKDTTLAMRTVSPRFAGFAGSEAYAALVYIQDSY